jgi:aminoglycoside/choline kinase family phosphotransferase
MKETEVIAEGYKELFATDADTITPLPRSGSDRRYYRVHDQGRSVIGTFNSNHEENEAFVGFSRHFRGIGLPVPEVYGYIPDRSIYFQQDLGDENLYTWLHGKKEISPFDAETKVLYRKILDRLVQFQVAGIKDLDLNLCYPHKSFDRQSMMWDMNYFKYMFLKLVAVPFNEKRLEHDFEVLADFLLSAGQDYFLYRDFQTANIMVIGGEPWFIDYQGGRKGSPQYDAASLLYDAKIPMDDSDRTELSEYFIMNFCAVTGEDVEKFRCFFSGFGMIRLMQALGAFGFRGLYEQKPTFTESIVPGVTLLSGIVSCAEENIHLPELYGAARAVSSTAIFRNLAALRH